MFLIGMLLAFGCMFVILYWWSEGAIEASEAIILEVVIGGLIFGLFAAQAIWQFLLAFVPLTSIAAYGYYSYRIGGTRAFCKKRCADYVAAIQADPRNLGAREFLADALYNMGQLDKAIDEMQAAVDLGASMECQYKLGKWTKERYLRDTTNPVCRWCETENSQGARKCSKCGADLPYETAFTRWIMGGKSSKARYYLIFISGVAIVGISLLLLPLRLAFIPLLFCIIALVGWALVSSARS